MLVGERRRKILEVLNSGKAVTVEELSQALDVSPSTVRRDLSFLQSKGLLLRTHGGAMPPSLTNYEPSLTEKENSMVEEKKAIGKYAASLIEEGDTVIIDAGSTTIEIVRNIRVNKAVIVTNFLRVSLEMPYKSDIEIIFTGGNFRFSTQAMVGPMAERFLERIRVDKAFIGTNGITLQGFSTPNTVEAATKRAMVQAGEKVFVVADSSKFNNESFIRFADIDEVDCVVTDWHLTRDQAEEFSHAGLEIIRVKEDGERL
jgi:DeoR family fructose operon transcriptional repressor